ncbi:MAG: glycosyltransferase family 39 protein [Acidobacteria bacterium]|nr:glycosyltransferase family 39 protein [Acidobacteriota bacterium]
MSTPGGWSSSRPLLALVFFLSLFCLGGPSTQIATAPLDPILATPAQDEALYSHGILRMAAGEDWLTPRFLGRPLLVKPPLLQWLSAVSIKIFGSQLWALRLPGILAAAAILTIVFHATGPVGWLLLVSTSLWRSRAGLVLMDDLLTVFYLVAILQFARDPKLTLRWAGYFVGGAVGLAIMTKWFAGVLPLALFLWARPPLRRWIEASIAILVVALPWHLYQFTVNPTATATLPTLPLLHPLCCSATGAGFIGALRLWLLPAFSAIQFLYPNHRSVMNSRAGKFCILTLTISSALRSFRGPRCAIFSWSSTFRQTGRWTLKDLGLRALFLSSSNRQKQRSMQCWLRIWINCVS